MNRQPFPSVLDSSLIAAWRSCPMKARFDFFEHWKPRTPSVHLHAGKAYAKGMEVARTAYYIGRYEIPETADEVDERGQPKRTIRWSSEEREPGDADSSVACGLRALMAEYGDFQCPPDSAKSLERTAGAFEYYFQVYPLDQDKAVPILLPSGRRGIEFSFAEPLDIKHPETGDPLLYVGRMDMIADYAGGRFGEDDKTTSQLGASWPKQWDLRSQFTGYCWGAERAGIPLSGFLVRGVSILKSKYETAQAITYRPKWMIEQWYEQLMERDIPGMLQAWETGSWGSNLDHACSEYGGCQFRQVCLAEPNKRIQWLRTSFERRRWDPVERVETSLSDEEAADA